MQPLPMCTYEPMEAALMTQSSSMVTYSPMTMGRNEKPGVLGWMGVAENGVNERNEGGRGGGEEEEEE